LSNSEIAELVNELVWNYRKIHLPDMEDDSTSPAEYAKCQRQSELAWSTLSAAFSHCSGFNQTMLRDMSEGAQERITSRLIEWSQDLEWPGGNNNTNGLWTSVADTAEECCDKTSSFMQDKLWPFTKIIR
jgi:hypothetical protein